MNTRRAKQPRRSFEAGETLLEVLIAMVILTGAISALIGGLASALLDSARNREQATGNTLLRSYAEAVKQSGREGFNCAGGIYVASGNRYVTPAGWRVGNVCPGANVGSQEVTVFACPPRLSSCTTSVAPFRLEIAVRLP